MAVQSGRGLLEVGGSDELRRLELQAARLVVEMDAQDLRGLAGREVDGLRLRDAPAVAEHELLARGADPLGTALVQDPSPLLALAREYARHLVYTSGGAVRTSL